MLQEGLSGVPALPRSLARRVQLTTPPSPPGAPRPTDRSGCFAWPIAWSNVCLVKLATQGQVGVVYLDPLRPAGPSCPNTSLPRLLALLRVRLVELAL